MTPGDAFALLRSALERAGVRYAIGGSWASIAFGEPRLINHADILAARPSAALWFERPRVRRGLRRAARGTIGFAGRLRETMTTQERPDRHDRQIAAIRALLQEGMKLAIETRKDMRTILAIQKRTDQKPEKLIDTMRRGGNGHAKRSVDLQ